VRQLNAALEERIWERTAALQAANEELETFTYSIAHDLRAPLRQVQSYAQLLEEECGEMLPSDGRGYLARIARRGGDMGRMVDDLLKLSVVSQQALERRETPLDVLCLEARAEIAPETAGREIEWRIGQLPSVSVSAALMKQVFVNLLSNAVKYTRPRRPAVIEVTAIRSGAEEAFVVRDNGVGFDMKFADRLFGVFQRLHSAGEFEGTGVGLALVARIIRRHGGRIWAEGKVGQGAAFYFTVGREKPAT
jgi:hypothetical protein